MKKAGARLTEYDFSEEYDVVRTLVPFVIPELNLSCKFITTALFVPEKTLESFQDLIPTISHYLG